MRLDEGRTVTAEPTVPGALWRNRLDRCGFVLLLVMIVVCPIPDGSVGLFWIVVWTGFAALAMLLLDFRRVNRTLGLMIAGLVLVLAAYLVVALLQSLSPGPAPLAIWSQAASLLRIDIPPLSSAVRDAPLVFLGRPLLAVLVLIAAMVSAQHSQRAALIVWVFILSSCLYAVFGWIALTFGLSGVKLKEDGDALTAFFISKNTTATYLGSALLASLAFLVTPMRFSSQRARRFRSILERLPRRHLLLLLVSGALLLILLPLTNSRAGLGLTLGLALGTLFLLVYRSRSQRIVLVVMLLGLFAVVFVATGEVWRARLAERGLESGGRLIVYLLMWQSILEHPWLGVGLGSFASTFPPLRTPDLGALGLWNIGHSTPLELAFEGGIPLFLVVSAGVLAGGCLLVKGIFERRHDPVVLAAFLVGLLGLLHSSFDFSLQLPGYLIIWCAITGAGLGRAALGPHRGHMRKGHRISAGVLQRSLGLEQEGR